MNKYEVMVVLKPLLPDDIRRGTMEKVEKTVKTLKGKVVTSEVWGKRHLAYEIKGHTDGYYVLWGIELPGEGVVELDKEIKLNSEVLRHIILRTEEFNLKEIK
jgi:small subunit ribosomal protein S6